jgi:hypothetical protein
VDCKTCEFKSVAFQKLTEEQIFKVGEHRVELSFKPGELEKGVITVYTFY